MYVIKDVNKNKYISEYLGSKKDSKIRITKMVTLDKYPKIFNHEDVAKTLIRWLSTNRKLKVIKVKLIECM